MRKDLQWFLHLCSEEEGLSAEHIHATIRGIDSKIDLHDLLGKLQEAGWISDNIHAEEFIKKVNKLSKKKEQPPPLPTPAQTDLSSECPNFEEWTTLDDASLKKNVLEWIEFCQNEGVSDLHLTACSRPRIRQYRKIVYLTENVLEPALAERLNLALLNEDQLAFFKKNWDLDYALHLAETEDGTQHRLRVNLIKAREGISGVYHMAHPKVCSLEDLEFPNAEKIRNLLSYHNGLILIAGPIGSGKTTTLASLLNELNDSRKIHIVTIEDPIEVVQSSKHCIVTQREVGRDTDSFGTALRSALREDPDVIVVGEMRDLETIEMAITAAETGHLVIGTLHTRDSASTLGRILDVFPSRQQSQIRAMAADSLRGIICQQLLPAADGTITLASELLINNSATANIMREGKDSGLESAMQTGRKQGMRTMDESIVELFNKGRISIETAVQNIKDRNLLVTEED